MNPDPPYRGRFAPSPTGPLHFGSLVAALGSWLFARRAGGQWLVRIEDLDPPREVPGAARQQCAALERFGLVPDAVPWVQSTRGDAYAAAVDSLLAAGHAFECHCSRSDLAAVAGIHKRCVGRPRPRRSPAVRLRVPEGRLGFQDRIQGEFSQDLESEVGDFVLRRADGFWAYQLAVVVDDAAQGITDVVRGADLLDSTPRQIYLQHCLGLPTPGYAHLPLVLDEQGLKLGKSLAALPVDAQAPLPALHAAWCFLGQEPRCLPRAGHAADALVAALPHFDPDRIPRTRPLAPVAGA
ncbi:tRNA glutamyl-Q(34) synthetase GluQRS [Arenimonas donghaensis]|uniref:Glutamyl-Q tRNA(Asp) synthetase n=1 Tax=Arenimonas donghaensis DSM 18148 = HO3-R19 TaxID=1121014 RepID=A0A087ML73_9GAMM|nr:tRNA glutamyl-Q(34) synthetase GluQRS [Arenimonas donghaensis]KFL37626.1 hypothetical protein N788_00220 [Arenimonas donghaensis DSM 18148 = HO3-R19]